MFKSVNVLSGLDCRLKHEIILNRPHIWKLKIENIQNQSTIRVLIDIYWNTTINLFFVNNFITISEAEK